MQGETLYPELSDRWRIALLAASLTSLLPQLGILLWRRDSAGLSPWYALSNALTAAEQFAFLLLSVADDEGDSSALISHIPATAGDWLNLGHAAAVWALWLAVFVLALAFQRGGQRGGSRLAAAVICLAHLLVSVAPLFAAVFLARELGRSLFYEHLDAAQVLFWGHLLGVLPATVVLRVLGVGLQAREVVVAAASGRASPLGRVGLLLGLQAVVFAAVAGSWLARFPIWRDQWLGDFLSVTLTHWFVMSDGMFAAGQGYLLWLASGGWIRVVAAGEGALAESATAATGDETEPLLGQRGC